MQEVWLHIWKNRSAVDANRAGELAVFLAVLARRRCIDLLRTKTPEQQLDDIAEPAAGELPDVVEQSEIAAAVAAFKQKLRPQWGRFFDLHFVQGLPYDDVAARMSISKLRCKYMKKVLATRARNNVELLAALNRTSTGAAHAP
ncbi:MAG: hypothetical protein A2138_20040 [Deltaproteobacteria bacterium RBG_16_71_12]|nr:MAG: hypothetical protein A2138_20040 [Deltaproteobacteria bacterium RBG_16_71_12]